MSDDSVAQVLETAIQTEVDGNAFSLKVAGASTNKLAKGLFESLASDEEHHEAWLRGRLAGDANPDGHLAAGTTRKMQTIFSSVSEAESDSFASSDDDTAALQHALDIERKGVAYYEKWASECSSEEARALCAIIAKEERSHVTIVGNMFEYLNETGNWFMGEERWSFDGGGSFA